MPILIITALLAITGILSWVLSFSPFIGFAIGLVLGIVFIICVLKKLAQRAVKSMIAWSILASILSYKITSHLLNQQSQGRKDDSPLHDDGYKDLVVLLQEQGFSSPSAKAAAKYAIDQMPNEPFPEKVRLALKYLDNGHKKEATIGRNK